MENLICPFCGGEVTLVVCDDEGNIHDNEYENNPWSGLGYMLYHDLTNCPNGLICPIAGHEEEGVLGAYIYDTRAEAVSVWSSQMSGYQFINDESEIEFEDI